MNRYNLTDPEWSAIESMLPNKPRGDARLDGRRVLNSILWVLRSIWNNGTCGGPVARARRQRVGAQQAVHLAVDLVHARDQMLLLFNLLEVNRELPLALPLAPRRGSPAPRSSRAKKAKAGACPQLRLDVLPQLPKALEIALLHGHADVADDALSDLAAVDHGLDELDQALRELLGVILMRKNMRVCGAAGISTTNSRYKTA